MAGLFDLITNNVVDYQNQPYDYYSTHKKDLINKYKEENVQDTNLYQSPVYLQNVKNINPLSANYGKAGVVFGDNPKDVNVNPNSFAPAVSTTGHEAFHVQSREYQDFLNKNNQIAKVLGVTIGNPNNYGLIDKREFNDWYDRVKVAYTKYKDKYNLGGQFGDVGFLGHTDETMADLQGIEAKLPSGQTILDTDIGKDIFKTKEEKQMYLKSSLPGIMKALEYDPSLWEVAKDRADYATRVFKDKATASSYAQAAADAFKAFISGPEAKVQYKDPFGDTTK